MHFVVHCSNYVTLISGVKCDTSPMSLTDTDDSHFSFGIFSVEALKFAEALQKCIDNRLDPDNYWNSDWIELYSGNHYDVIRISRNCANISITRGNLKILYYGSVGSLAGLPEAIIKEYQRYDKQNTKELKEWTGIKDET